LRKKLISDKLYFICDPQNTKTIGATGGIREIPKGGEHKTQSIELKNSTIFLEIPRQAIEDVNITNPNTNQFIIPEKNICPAYPHWSQFVK